MDNTKVIAEELKVALAADIDRLAQKMAVAEDGGGDERGEGRPYYCR